MITTSASTALICNAYFLSLQIQTPLLMLNISEVVGIHILESGYKQKPGLHI